MSGSGRCPTRPLPRRVRPAARRRHASTRFLDSSSKPTRVTFARFGITMMDIHISMRLAADGTECRQRSIDRTSSGSKRDRKAPSIVPCAPTKYSREACCCTRRDISPGTDWHRCCGGIGTGSAVAVPYHQKGDARLSRIPSFVSVEIAT